ncbi:MAG: hypothetical protein JWP80_2862 [Pseudomonas sp.]|nr:hypothetical protein [Pseudomonas sp.]
METFQAFFNNYASTKTAAMADCAFAIGLLVAIVLSLFRGPVKDRVSEAQLAGSAYVEEDAHLPKPMFIPGAPGYRLFVLFVGLLVGCAGAVIIVPYSPLDKQVYATISGALGLLVTGYLLSKLDGVWTSVLYTSSAKNALNYWAIELVGFFIVGFALSATVVVVNRTEWLSEALRCDPVFYGRFLEKEVVDKMRSDSATCNKLGIVIPAEIATKTPEPKPATGKVSDRQARVLSPDS